MRRTLQGGTTRLSLGSLALGGLCEVCIRCVCRSPFCFVGLAGLWYPARGSFPLHVARSRRPSLLLGSLASVWTSGNRRLVLARTDFALKLKLLGVEVAGSGSERC